MATKTARRKTAPTSETLNTDEIWTFTYDAAGKIQSLERDVAARGTTASTRKPHRSVNARTGARPASSTRASPTRARDVIGLRSVTRPGARRSRTEAAAARHARASNACGGCRRAALAQLAARLGTQLACDGPLSSARGFRSSRAASASSATLRSPRAPPTASAARAATQARCATAAPRRAGTRSRCGRAPSCESPPFCKDCHEFATPAFDDGGGGSTSLPMQSTYSEWTAYRARRRRRDLPVLPHVRPAPRHERRARRRAASPRARREGRAGSGRGRLAFGQIARRRVPALVGSSASAASYSRRASRYRSSR